MVGAEVVADAGYTQDRRRQRFLDRLVLAGQAVHVGGRAAQVGDDAGEARRLVADFLDLAQDRRLRAALDDAAFVLGDRAEGAAAEAAAHDVDREADHLPGRDLRLAIARVRRAGIGQVVDAVHLGRGQRHRRRIEPDVALAVRLHQGAGVAGVGFEVEDARGVGVEHRVVLHLLVGGQADHGLVALFLGQRQALFAAHDADRLDHFRRDGGVVGGAGGLVFLGHGVGIGMRIDRAGRVDAGRVGHRPVVGRQPAGRHHEGGAAQVADVLDVFARGQAVGQFHQRALGVAEEQHVGLGIGQHRAAHLVRPVVVMGDAAQAGLDGADDHRHVRESLAAALGIDDHRAVGPLVRLGVGRVGVVGADLAVGGVAVDHRIHVAGGDAEEQVRLAQRAEGVGRVPVGLADDADAEALRFQQAPDQRHAEAGMVDVGVAGDEDDVARIPAERVHFGARHGQERRSSSAARPLGDGRKQIDWGAHWAALYRKSVQKAADGPFKLDPACRKTAYISITCDMNATKWAGTARGC